MVHFDSLASIVVFLGGLVTFAAGQGGDCPSRCPAGKRLAPIDKIRPYSNGCSVPPFIQLPDFTFTQCCDLHDTCYMTCGVSKAYCEKAFGQCLKAHCKKAYNGNGECTSTADTFVMGVEMFGCQGYQESQQQGCECLPKADASARYASYLKDFRLAYNGTELSEDLVRKYANKEGQLVYKLYQAYPTSIDVIGTDGQRQRDQPAFFAVPPPSTSAGSSAAAASHEL